MTATDDSKYPLAGPAVELRPLAKGRMDLSDWDDLMEVVEMLCPVWPPRDPRAQQGRDYRL